MSNNEPTSSTPQLAIPSLENFEKSFRKQVEDIKKMELGQERNSAIEKLRQYIRSSAPQDINKEALNESIDELAGELKTTPKPSPEPGAPKSTAQSNSELKIETITQKIMRLLKEALERSYAGEKTWTSKAGDKVKDMAKTVWDKAKERANPSIELTPAARENARSRFAEAAGPSVNRAIAGTVFDQAFRSDMQQMSRTLFTQKYKQAVTELTRIQPNVEKDFHQKMNANFKSTREQLFGRQANQEQKREQVQTQIEQKTAQNKAQQQVQKAQPEPVAEQPQPQVPAGG